jgi:hypothetical protein
MTTDLSPTERRAEFAVDLPLRLVQALRLAHALAESDYQLCIAEEDAIKFARLKEVFGLNYTVGKTAPVLPGLRLSHPEPITAIGSIERPLIFPHEVFEHCRRLWADSRATRYLFVGLITGKRHAVLSRWLARTYPDSALELPRNESFGIRLRRKILRAFSVKEAPALITAESGGLVCWASESGSHFPMKAWHDEYYEQMARAQFVLCPDGDFVWTYRFFEAILCGAVPVIENRCAAYEGFRFATMQDDLSGQAWSESTALHNFALARQRLTVSRELLNGEIASLLRGIAMDPLKPPVRPG